MPAFAFTRQPDPLAWFGTGHGGSILTSEHARLSQALTSRSPQPWLWVAPPGSDPAQGAAPATRGVRLQADATSRRLTGHVQCGLPLPLPTEAVGAIVLQHVLDAGDPQPLLQECARVLEPGGRLWLFVLNPWSPYRLRWRGAGLVPRTLGQWHLQLAAAGLAASPHVLHYGPVWRAVPDAPGHGPAPFRAARLLEAEKRVAGLIPPAPVARAWRAAPAA
ncbi:class I SAM-dependent methyltransferase [Pseudoxanthomonas sp.]|jgi:SAM-dependent methyltransferase|uniref:class I SAM-dependent methyltransferase n=1 Tax=Pseudoxanthomonas sp. TaxID=1871049 RepID=UPI002E0D808D|nr:class I SAM-dependent methyltransferase [Pseudoxanthomonas sp.]